ncbi:MAG: adenylate/guanylate cyclase domain-containing protein [Burkholderiaceae bacterium]
MRRPEKAAAIDSPLHPLLRGSSAQRLRLASGLVLFAFAATHFLNHALGLVSLEAMLAFDAARTAVTRSVPGSLVLGVALLVHAASALTRLAARATLRLPAWEWLQLGLGLVIPLLLLPHIVNTRIAALAFGVDTTYPYALTRIWPDAMPAQTLLLLVVWAHGCIGLHHWLRLAPAYRRVAPRLLVAATLLPCLALVGVVTQGREMARANADPSALAALRTATRWPDAAEAARLADWREASAAVFYAVALGAAGFGALRMLRQRRSMRIPVQYLDGPRVRSASGPTLLEVSRLNGIGHMSVCGGRGRCSTCRVRVLGDADGLSPVEETERRTLRSIRAPADVRLACQARVLGAVTVQPLVRPRHGADAPALAHADEAAGVERELAVLFIDIRGFTALTEQKLAYDVVYLLNHFFHAVGQAVYGTGGWINDRAGDGVLAVFDPAFGGLPAACRSALFACGAVDREVTQLNARMQSDLARPIRIAMGLHCGRHVLGRIGVGEAMTLSVVGPALNVASRLEAIAKQADVQLAVSVEAARHGGLDPTGLAVQTTAIRGLQNPLEVLLVERAQELGLRLAQATQPQA